MGCAQSRIENEEAVSRCKDRRNFMKEAVSARNAFAAAHSAYSMALKNSGAALSDYAHGEAENNDLHHRPLDPTSQPSVENLPPPPPPPDLSPSPLQRAVTMPAELSVPRPGRKKDVFTISEDEDEAIEEDGDGKGLERRRSKRNGVGEAENEAPLPPPSPPQTPPITPVPPSPLDVKGATWDYFFMVENMAGPSLNDSGEIRDEKDGNESEVFDERVGGIGNVGGELGGNVVDGVEPKTPEKMVELSEEEKKAKQIVHSNTAPPDVGRGLKAAVDVNLVQILSDIDDCFLKASENAQEVSKILEANRLHYHSNFADNRGHIDHAARVMRVITWNRSFKGMPNADGGRDEIDAEEHETHASVLDKLLAWEKKLYDEVKAGELMKLEYQRKVSLLNKQKKRGASSESLEKTKAAVSHLHTRYIVDMQSMDSTVSEVNHLRDDQLYPKLVALVNGMAKMWETMCIHHDSQLNIVKNLKSLDISHAPKETSQHHHERTMQLWNVVQEWHAQFEKLVTHEKQYIQALNSWLKLNLIPIESSLKEKISSPPRIQHPPIQTLLHSWHDYLEKLPDELPKTAISSFAAVIKTILVNQEDEMKLKEKCEETGKEYLRKKQAFEEWYQKYMQHRTPPDETDPDRTEDTDPKDPISVKQFALESLKKRWDEEVEKHQRQCVQVREKSLGSLKTRLPELFRAMSDHAHACSDTYERLRFITESQNQNGGPS